jgi:putative SOS response-associated peptidase YedK
MPKLKHSTKSHLSKTTSINDAWYWQMVFWNGNGSMPKEKKQGYQISLPNNEVFAFAGLWSEWLDPSTGELINSYTILTTEATGLMAEIHNSKKRMPIILAPEQEAAWLSETNYLDFKDNKIELLAEKIQDVQGSLL